jgi:hypothetical protein
MVIERLLCPKKRRRIWPYAEDDSEIMIAGATGLGEQGG